MQRIILVRNNGRKVIHSGGVLYENCHATFNRSLQTVLAVWEESNLGLPSFPAKICVYGSRGIRIVKCLVRPRMQLKLPNVV